MQVSRFQLLKLSCNHHSCIYADFHTVIEDTFTKVLMQPSRLHLSRFPYNHRRCIYQGSTVYNNQYASFTTVPQFLCYIETDHLVQIVQYILYSSCTLSVRCPPTCRHITKLLNVFKNRFKKTKRILMQFYTIRILY